MSSRIPVSILGGLVSASLFLLPALAHADPGECFRDTECSGANICINTECLPSPEPLGTCTGPDTCGWDFACVDNFCKLQGVHCTAENGDCYFENSSQWCTCEDPGGASGDVSTSSDGGGDTGTATDEELYEDCLMEVEICDPIDFGDGDGDGDGGDWTSTDSGWPGETGSDVTTTGEDWGEDTGDDTSWGETGGVEESGTEGTSAGETVGESGEEECGDDGDDGDEGTSTTDGDETSAGEDGGGSDTTGADSTATASTTTAGEESSDSGAGQDDDFKGCSIGSSPSPGFLMGLLMLVGLRRRRSA